MISKLIILLLSVTWATGQFLSNYLPWFHSWLWLAHLCRDVGGLTLCAFLIYVVVFQIRIMGWRPNLIWPLFYSIFLLIAFFGSLLVQQSYFEKQLNRSIFQKKQYEASLQSVRKEQGTRGDKSMLISKIEDIIYEENKMINTWVIKRQNNVILLFSITLLVLILVVSAIFLPSKIWPEKLLLKQLA